MDLATEILIFSVYFQMQIRSLLNCYYICLLTSAQITGENLHCQEKQYNSHILKPQLVFLRS
jgi:hypothetical protein